MLAESLNNFFFKPKEYIITKENGFYILPYVGNSPHVIINSLSKIPYNTYDSQNNIISTDNPFTKGTIEYQEIEEGLWVMYSDLLAKKNISHKRLNDPELPCDYYSLAFRMDKSDSTIQIINNQYFKETNALLSKPKASAFTRFHKDTKATSLIIFFSTKWLEKNINNNATAFYNSIQYFIDSKRDSLVIPNFFSNSKELNEDIASIFSTGIGNANKNQLDLKIKTLELLKFFLFKITSTTDQKYTLLEDLVLKYIYQPFPGIDYFSKEVGISPSKLKTEFKKETKKTIFQFFQEKQMVLAKEMLSNDSLLIKNIAYSLGYQNVSKFSAAFKKHHGHLPSVRN